MKSRIGRPKRRPPAAVQVVTRRVRRLIDTAHEGNVHEASKVSGLAYATIRDLYSGRSTNPSLRTLQKLASTYGVSPGWFTDESQLERVPFGGWVSYVPSREGATSKAERREIVIPFSAWSFRVVYEQLHALLLAIPAGENRPIVGAETDEELVSLLVSKHLLAPILDAERISGHDLILRNYMAHQATNQQREVWLSRLRRIGMIWQEILSDFLPATEQQ